jgi:aspartyl-tRNA(Asn)/glutamyl-tRNA(Gln) amidotransferase subunit A
MDLLDCSAAALAASVSRGELPPREVVQRALGRIEAVNGRLNALIDVDADDALGQADAVAQRLRLGESLPLAGVPISVKDNLWVGGRRITFGSRLFAGHVASRDAWAVARLRQAGAVVIGISNCSEFACRGVTVNPLHGATLNPLSIGRTPGGSSGGAVASVAAGMAALALATDAGGSIRRPAAHTGLVGLKPTFGRVPHPWGFADPSAEISVVGPIARCVDDVALALSLLTAHDSRDLYSAPGLVAQAPMRPLRLAYSPRLGCDFAVDADVAAAVAYAVSAAERLGHRVVVADPDWPPGTGAYPLLELQQAALASLFGARWRTEPELFDPDLGAQIEAGFAVGGTRIAQLLRLRESLALALGEFFTRHDLLLTPTVPCEPWPVDRSAPDTIDGQPVGPRAHAAFTPLFNYCGVPAVSLPCGTGDAGLPIGLQIVGPRWHDERVLALARELEAVLPHRARAPSSVVGLVDLRPGSPG